MTPVDPLMSARALVIRDLASQQRLDAHTVSMLEECLSQRRWWLSQWAAGAGYIAGLVAQDMQDALFDESQRWPICETCAEPTVHSLAIEPELGPDPHWVCSQSGSVIAALGRLADVRSPRSDASAD